MSFAVAFVTARVVVFMLGVIAALTWTARYEITGNGPWSTFLACVAVIYLGGILTELLFTVFALLFFHFFAPHRLSGVSLMK
jgi:hypothetical protein